MNSESDDISLQEAIHRVRRNWRRVAIGAAIGVAAGAIIAFSLRPVYVGEVLVVPQTSGSGGQIESLARRFGGLASMAGIELGGLGGEGTDRDVALATLTSYETLSEFLRAKEAQNRVLREGTAWPFRPLLSEGSGTMWRAVKVLREHLRVVPDKESNLVKVSVAWYDSRTASDWSNELVALADRRLRDDALRTSQGRLGYLQKELVKSNVVPVREAVSKVIENELRSMAIAGADKHFALRVIDAAVAPDKPARPRRLLIIASFLLLGGLVGMASAVLRVRTS